MIDYANGNENEISKPKRDSKSRQTWSREHQAVGVLTLGNSAMSWDMLHLLDKLFRVVRNTAYMCKKINSEFVCIIKKVKLFLCITNYALRHEDVWGSGYTDPFILELGTSWRRAVSFTPLPLYSLGKSPRYPLDRRLGGPQSRSGRCGEEKNLAPTGTRTPTPRPSSP
jgi:hypothetical protein